MLFSHSLNFGGPFNGGNNLFYSLAVEINHTEPSRKLHIMNYKNSEKCSELEIAEKKKESTEPDLR